MGKKHKKHHRSDEANEELGHDRQPPKDPIRLVLKVGHGSHGYSPAASPSVPPPAPPQPVPTPATAAASTAGGIDDDRKHKHHKKSKKKKKKRDRSRDGDDGAAATGLFLEDARTPVAVPERPLRPLAISELLSDGSTPASRKRAAPPPLDQSTERRSLREPRQCTLGGREEALPVNALNETLSYIHRLMQKRDNNGFFSFPVNDTIAPGYSTIIKQPMDLSTMKSKIEGYVYRNVMEYKADLKLICVNAMTYNHPETVYYKAAQKLLEYGMRTLSKERLSSWRKSMPFMATIADHELALDQDVDASEYVAPVRVQKKEKIKNYLHFEPIPDNLPAKDILALAQEAAKAASDELVAKHPRSKMGFLRQREDGTTTLNFLNPDSSGYVSEKERIVTIGQIAGKLQSGTWALPGFKEDERNKAVPVTYLNYGPFASHAPSHDSAFANLTKEESSLLLSVYGSEMPMAYARSVMDFVAGADDHIIKMADALLDTLTSQKHSAAMKALNESRDKQQHQKEVGAADANEAAVLPAQADSEGSQATKDASSGTSEVPPAGAPAGVGAAIAAAKATILDFKSLRSLSNLGIDTSFIDVIEQQHTVQSQLGRASTALQALELLQSSRLGGCAQQPLLPVAAPMLPLPTVMAAPERWPSETEVKLAFDVTRELSLLTKQVNPGDVISTEAVHNALGIARYGTEMSVGRGATTAESDSVVPPCGVDAATAFAAASVSESNTAHSAVLSETLANNIGAAVGSDDPLEQYLGAGVGTCP